MALAPVLPPAEVVRVQIVSKRFLDIARDDKLWKILCFEHSQAEALRKRRELVHQAVWVQSQELHLPRAAKNPTQQSMQSHEDGAGTVDRRQDGSSHLVASNEVESAEARRRRALVNWDPSYEGQKINWYEDYIHRHAPISLSWLQPPYSERGNRRQPLDARSVSVLNGTIDEDSEHESIAVAALGDGSVCLWSLGDSHPQNKYGSIIGRSRANLVDSNGGYSQSHCHPSLKPLRSNPAVVHSASIDEARKSAFFAVDDTLTQVDLPTLQVVTSRRFPGPISALSDGTPSLPLTVGVHDGLYLHDDRVRGDSGSFTLDASARCDIYGQSYSRGGWQDVHLKSIVRKGMPDHAPLLEPGPVSILHVPHPGRAWDVDSAIYVAGRFPSILCYDRRIWPRLSGAIHSGARLSGLASLPGLFRTGSQRPSNDQIGAEHKARPQAAGTTLISCGEYKGRGSLELYGLSSESADLSSPAGSRKRMSQRWNVKNRHTASRSKLLSVARHGTRIVFSDGDGMVKWVERDGSTEVRQWNINSMMTSEPHRLFSGDQDSGDVVRKILSIKARPKPGESAINHHQLLLWTGERLGVLSSSPRSPTEAGFEWEAVESSPEGGEISDEQRLYSQRMRRALERQADETRFMRGLGLGLI